MGLTKVEKYFLAGLFLSLGLHLLLSETPNTKILSSKQEHTTLVNSENSLSSKRGMSSVQKLKRINKNLGEVDAHKRLLGGQTDIDNFKVQDIKEDKFVHTKNIDLGVSLKGENPFEKLTLKKESIRELSPGDKITRILADKQWEESYDQAYKQAFIDEFVKKAQESGYKIKVNDKLEVISVRKLKQKNSYVIPF